MEIYVLMGFIWLIGWLYSCGVHYGCKEITRDRGKEEDKAEVDQGGWLQYLVLFIGWPHYLGSGKD